MFIEEIKSALGTKYANFGLSKEAIDRIALQVEKTVTTEEEVESGIATFETMNLVAQEIQKMRDRELRNRSDLQKSFDAYKESHPDKNDEGNGGEKEPEWAKALREQNQALMEKFTRQEQEEQRNATLAFVKQAAKSAGCTNERALKLTEKTFSIKDKETNEDAAKRFEAEYNANVKEYFGDGTIPPFGSSAELSTDEQFHSAMQSYAASKGLAGKES